MAKKKTSKKPAAKHYGQRADFGAGAEPYYAKVAPPDLSAAASKLRKLIRSTIPGATEALKWGVPMYAQDGVICYVKAAKGYLRFGFYGQDAGGTDPDNLLGGGGKQLRHIRVTSAADIKPALFKSWIKQAVKANAAKK